MGFSYFLLVFVNLSLFHFFYHRLFTIITYKYPELVQYYEIGQDGLLGVFFENLKNNTLLAKQEKSNLVQVNPHSKENIALYVMTYN